jgi:hypothetical protein
MVILVSRRRRASRSGTARQTGGGPRERRYFMFMRPPSLAPDGGRNAPRRKGRILGGESGRCRGHIIAMTGEIPDNPLPHTSENSLVRWNDHADYSTGGLLDKAREIFVEFAVGNVRNTQRGYESLARLATEMTRCFLEEIHLNFCDCKWFEANMSAPLGVVLACAADDLNDVSIVGMHEKTKAILARNGFLTEDGYAPRRDSFGSTVPYRRLNPGDERYFIAYLRQYLERQKIPGMTEALRMKFRESILEIFVNAATHSETKLGIFACGQYFPKQERLDFSIADAGIGIRKKIANELGLKMNSDKAIEWALEEGNTVRRGNVPGGLGLKLLREFVRLNGGRLQIVSDRGYWEMMNDGRETLTRMECPFPGTVVTIEINTADTKSYRLQSENSQEASP